MATGHWPLITATAAAAATATGRWPLVRKAQILQNAKVNFSEVEMFGFSGPEDSQCLHKQKVRFRNFMNWSTFAIGKASKYPVTGKFWFLRVVML